MSLEVRELVVKVNVGSQESAAPRGLDDAALAALKREVVAACLAELRHRKTERDER